MASQYKRLLAPTTLSASMQPPLEMIFDAGAFQTLEVEVRVLKAGSAGKIKLQHAATGDEPDSWIDLASATVDLDAAGASYLHVASFLRYIRWVGDGSVAGSPVVQVDLVAKGG
jgi:hypothetical protein